MDWTNEPFRKAYDQPGQWHCLRVSARGLWLELQFYVDDLGTFRARGVSLVTALARALGAHRHESKRLLHDIEMLVREQYITIQDNVLTVCDFAAAQRRAGPYARKTYKKIYRPCGSWLSLPLSSRAMGKDMLFCVDNDGMFRLRGGLHDGSRFERVDPSLELAYGLGMGREERHRVGFDLQALLDDRYVVMASEGLVIKNYTRAQARVGEAAERASHTDMVRINDVKQGTLLDQASQLLEVRVRQLTINATSNHRDTYRPTVSVASMAEVSTMRDDCMTSGSRVDDDCMTSEGRVGHDCMTSTQYTEVTPQNHSGVVPKIRLVGRKEGRKEEEEQIPESPKAPPGPCAAEPAPGSVVCSSYTSTTEEGQLDPSVPQVLVEPTPPLPRVPTVPPPSIAEWQAQVEEEITARVTASLVPQLRQELMAHAEADVTALSTAIAVSTTRTEMDKHAIAQRIELERKPVEGRKGMSIDEMQAVHTRKSAAATRRIESQKAQQMLFDCETPQMGSFTVAEMISTLCASSSGVFLPEKIISSVGGMLARQVKEIIQAGRTLEDVKVLGAYIGAKHFAYLPGGSPTASFLGRVGVMHEFISEALRWDASGRPSPDAWCRGRGRGSSKAGYAPAPTRAEIESDPVYLAGKDTHGAGLAINPWGNDDDLSQRAKSG